MNATIDPQAIADAYEDDPIAAASEYGAEFRSDVESFVSLETVLSAVDKGVYERPPRHGVSYRGFCDPSGGHADSYTLGVAHSEGDKIILDLLREVRPPMSPPLHHRASNHRYGLERPALFWSPDRQEDRGFTGCSRRGSYEALIKPFKPPGR